MMKTIISSALIFTFLFSGILCIRCKKDEVLSDLDKKAALRNVTVAYDSAAINLGLPAGAISGKSFQQLKKEDSAKYCNPQNYSITFVVTLLANNKKEGARDAAFDGMTLHIIMDTIQSSPLNAVTDSFEVKKNTTRPVQVMGTINLKTHRLAGLYIFRQMVDGNDISTTQTPSLNYTIGALQGTIDLPSFHENIPTRASEETKAFLRGLLDSGIFNVPK
jgi:hypothetical protein